MAIVGSILWVTTVGLWWLAGVAEPWGGVEYESRGSVSGLFYTVGAATLLAASVLTFVTLLALHRRHGGLGVMGRVGLGFSGLGVAGALAAWVFVGWGLMLAIGTFLVANAMLGRDIAPRRPTWTLGLGVALGAVVWVVLRSIDGTLLQWGGLWGDDWVPNLVGVTVAAVVLAFGLFGFGSWLRGETPIDISDSDQTVTA